MDEANWLTPSIADILEQGAPPPGGDGSIRDHMLTIQRELADMETPAKIINVRSMPSYTLYIAKPETIGRLGNRRTISSQEIRRSLARVAESHSDWLIGFMPKLQDDENTIGILLRTDAHRPLSLRRLLVRSTFRTTKSLTSFILGITLEQELVVNNLETLRHLLIVGSDNAKQHFMRGLIITLISLNTPSELRLILAGKGNESIKALVATPHTLGKIIVQPDSLQRILEGLVNERQRRESVFTELEVSDIAQFNDIAKEHGKGRLPRLLVILDSLTDPDWQTGLNSFLPMILSLLKSGDAFGIHFIVTINDSENFQPFRQIIKTHIVMRTSAKLLTDQIPDFHPSLLRFVDGFIVEVNGTEARKITPVEICSTTNKELFNAVTYWQETRQQRQEETPTIPNVSGKTGMTDLLTPPDMTPPQKPNISQKNTNPILTRATAILLDRDTQVMEVSSAETITSETNITVDLTKQATVLANYLGWLSINALMEIFLISEETARHILETLKQNSVLEEEETITHRFLLS